MSVRLDPQIKLYFYWKILEFSNSWFKIEFYWIFWSQCNISTENLCSSPSSNSNEISNMHTIFVAVALILFNASLSPMQLHKPVQNGVKVHRCFFSDKFFFKEYFWFKLDWICQIVEISKNPYKSKPSNIFSTFCPRSPTNFFANNSNVSVIGLDTACIRILCFDDKLTVFITLWKKLMLSIAEMRPFSVWFFLLLMFLWPWWPEAFVSFLSTLTRHCVCFNTNQYKYGALWTCFLH